MDIHYSMFDCYTCFTENSNNRDLALDSVIDGRYKPWKVDSNKLKGGHKIQEQKHENLHKNKPYRGVALKFFEKPVELKEEIIEEINIEVPAAEKPKKVAKKPQPKEQPKEPKVEKVEQEKIDIVIEPEIKIEIVEAPKKEKKVVKKVEKVVKEKK